MIENLPLLAPDASRSARTIARCHDRLAARRRKIEARNRRAEPGERRRPSERLLWRGFCVVYLVAMAGDVLAIAARALKRQECSIGGEGGTSMVPVLSLLIPIALSAVFVFIASSIIHMATPWHKNDLMKLPE